MVAPLCPRRGLPSGVAADGARPDSPPPRACCTLGVVRDGVPRLDCARGDDDWPAGIRPGDGGGVSHAPSARARASPFAHSPSDVTSAYASAPRIGSRSLLNVASARAKRLSRCICRSVGGGGWGALRAGGAATEVAWRGADTPLLPERILLLPPRCLVGSAVPRAALREAPGRPLLRLTPEPRPASAAPPPALLFAAAAVVELAAWST